MGVIRKKKKEVWENWQEHLDKKFKKEKESED